MSNTTLVIKPQSILDKPVERIVGRIEAVHKGNRWKDGERYNCFYTAVNQEEDTLSLLDTEELAKVFKAVAEMYDGFTLGQQKCAELCLSRRPGWVPVLEYISSPSQ